MPQSALARRGDPEPQVDGDFYGRVIDLLVTLHRADPHGWGHYWRVARQAASVGRALELSRKELRTLWWGGLLHDVGKIRMPQELLGKRGALSRQERALVERHPEIGAEIVEDLGGLEVAAPLVLHHQERYDGRRDVRFPGYPAGLAGDEIPLGGRILAVVDAYDAMTSDRPYRRALPHGDACAELHREAGHQFDPRVVEAFLEVVARPGRPGPRQR